MIEPKLKELLSSGKFSEAKGKLEIVIQNDPTNTEALNLLAFIELQTGNFLKAINHLEKVATIDKTSSAPFVNLGIAFFHKGENEIALKYFEKAIARDRNNTVAHYNYAIALADSGSIDKAIEEYETVLKIDKSYYSAYYNLSLLYLLIGNYTKGFEYFEYRFKSEDLKRKELPGKRWNGEVAKDKTLYVYADQGFGDVIQFIRFVKLAKERVGKIVLEVQIELLGLLKTLDFVDKIVPTRPDFSPMAKYDFQIPLMSLPFALKSNKENFSINVPYINTDKEKTEKWKALLNSDKRKIGIAWRGNPVYSKNHIRSTDVKYFKEFFSEKDALFVSLQKDIYDREKEFLLANEVIDLSEYLSDFSETAAIIKNIDLIITTDTVIPHLSGALGKPVFLMLAKIPDWRWGLTGTKSLWYPTLHLFRQKKLGVWKDVFTDAKMELRRFLSGN